MGTQAGLVPLLSSRLDGNGLPANRTQYYVWHAAINWCGLLTGGLLFGHHS